ncbi:hypothetical protein AVEN_174848-1 [Araneus ventricosus]|uniref:Uncharacterized protein n=1 Tax=Araneus ventricosus TaxID=182803 RepID=A0A4Y2PAX8_ARAVE|nr:hypothetical protein AVEN_174848-1 [Araneus ventricosus]
MKCVKAVCNNQLNKLQLGTKEMLMQVAVLRHRRSSESVRTVAGFRSVQIAILEINMILSYHHEKNTRHADGGRYGNGVFHCILGVKERTLFHVDRTGGSLISL